MKNNLLRMLAGSLSMALCVSYVNAGNVLKVNASEPSAKIITGHFNLGSDTSPDDIQLSANSQYLTKNGKPWFPLMGEFHYTRFPSQFWEEEILKIKSSGLEVIATYVIWNHHEEKAGQFNWKDNRDLRKFIQLCQKHGMKVLIRIGPWAHGEVRYGGSPDWVVQQMPTRRNDATYLHYVERYWSQISEQVKGLMWKDGGPIIGTQLENEYNLAGPGMGAEHISTLKSLALKLGFDTPYYTVTGWDGAIYPKGEVLPVFAGYADEPWGLGTTKMNPNEVYTFRFNNRVSGDAGAQTAATTAGTAIEDMDTTPYLGAEFGPGVPIMYRRRALMQPDDIGAMLPVQLGSGANLYGYYMYHGGSNPKGQTTTLEENALLGGYNDCPIINYDFQAPYGQYGQKHDVLNKIMPFHNFVRNFGERLAEMEVFVPNTKSRRRDDFETPRFSVRAKGDSGFVFFNNYIRQYTMHAQNDVSFDISLPSGDLRFPSKPVSIPSGSYFIWPFNFDLDGTNLAWATSQPVARIESDKDEVTYFFSSEKDIKSEFAVRLHGEQKIVTSQDTNLVDGLTILNPIPSTSVAFSIKDGSKVINIVNLPEDVSEDIWMGSVGSRTYLVLSDNEVVFTGKGLKLSSVGSHQFKFAVYPSLQKPPKSDLKLSRVSSDGVFSAYTAKAVKREILVKVVKTREEQKVLPIKIGGTANAALQPFPEQFGKSAAWSIEVSKNALKDLEDAYLTIDYVGDVGRLFSGTELLNDDFYSGRMWVVGLRQYPDEIEKPLTLTVMPLRKDAPIYIDEAVRDALPEGDQVATVKSVSVVPKYSLNLNF